MRLWQVHIGKEMKGKTFCPYSSIVPWSGHLRMIFPCFLYLTGNHKKCWLYLLTQTVRHLLFFPSRGPVRIREILQLVEPGLSHVRSTLTHLETSHPLKRQHLRCRAALLTPVWTRGQRRVRTSRLSLPLGDLEGSSSHTLHGTGLLCQDRGRGVPNRGHASPWGAQHHITLLNT